MRRTLPSAPAPEIFPGSSVPVEVLGGELLSQYHSPRGGQHGVVVLVDVLVDVLVLVDVVVLVVVLVVVVVVVPSSGHGTTISLQHPQLSTRMYKNLLPLESVTSAPVHSLGKGSS